MSFLVYRWQGETPYQDKNRRQKATQPPASRSIYPWLSMKPGDFFFVPVTNIHDKNTIRSLSNSIRNSAKVNGLWVKIDTFIHSVRGHVIRVRHDGIIK